MPRPVLGRCVDQSPPLFLAPELPGSQSTVANSPGPLPPVCGLTNCPPFGPSLRLPRPELHFSGSLATCSERRRGADECHDDRDGRRNHARQTFIPPSPCEAEPLEPSPRCFSKARSDARGRDYCRTRKPGDTRRPRTIVADSHPTPSDDTHSGRIRSKTQGGVAGSSPVVDVVEETRQHAPLRVRAHLQGRAGAREAARRRDRRRRRHRARRRARRQAGYKRETIKKSTRRRSRRCSTTTRSTRTPRATSG